MSNVVAKLTCSIQTTKANESIKFIFAPGEYVQLYEILPLGSTSREILIASLVARSWFAGEIARIIQFGWKNRVNLILHPKKFTKIGLKGTIYACGRSCWKWFIPLNIMNIHNEHIYDIINTIKMLSEALIGIIFH